MDSPQSTEIGLEEMRCCRACLSVASQHELNDYRDLLETFTASRSDATATLLDTLNKYAQLKITPDDFAVEGYPPCHYLCGRCRQDLRQSCEFITRAQLNNQLLMGNYTTAQLDAAANELEQIQQTTESRDMHDQIHHEFYDESENWEGKVEYISKEFDSDESNANFGDDQVELINANDDDLENVTNKDSNKTDEYTSQNQLQTLSISIEGIVDNELNEDDAQIDENEQQRKEATSHDVDSSSSHPVDPSIGGTRKTCYDFKCEFCTSIFEFQRDLLHHYELDHGDKNLNFLCDVCENRFVTKNALRLHRRQVHQKDEYMDCNICGRALLKSFYNIHLRRHKELKFLCSKCPKICASRLTLNKHMALHSEDRDRNIECVDCGRRFYTNENLQLHQAVHVSPEKRANYECTICSKTFLRKKNLGLHMQMHRGETIDCPHCGKKFVRAKDLEVHIRFHTGDYPFACSMCDRKFAIKGHLNYHEKRHLGVRYKCDECEKTFINLGGLRQHQYEHTGMPLLCGICQRGFPTNFKVRRHLRTVHRHLFKKTGYTDALAKKYITLASNVCEEAIEMLEEHADDIPTSLFTN